MSCHSGQPKAPVLIAAAASAVTPAVTPVDTSSLFTFNMNHLPIEKMPRQGNGAKPVKLIFDGKPGSLRAQEDYEVPE